MHRKLSWGVALVLAASSWGASMGPALAKTAVHLTAHVSPATAYIGSAVVVSGTAKPAGSVEVDRLVGKVWKPLLHAKTAKSGAFSIAVRMPRTAGIFGLRVVRGTVVSHKILVRVTKSIYSVGMTIAPPAVDVGQPVVVSGVVKPKATGRVRVQELRGNVWVDIARVALSSHSAYQATVTASAGSHRWRVVVGASRLIAGSTGNAATLVVLPAVTVTTTQLPRASVKHAYSAQLAAAGGQAPYTWRFEGTDTEAGLRLSPSGGLSGTPNIQGDQVLSVVATDALGGVANASLNLTITPRYGPMQAWGGNTSGELGDGTTTQRGSPVTVSGIATATSVVGSASSGYAVLTDGTVWAWGDNHFGQLGDGSAVLQRNTPGPVPGLTDVIAVAGSQFDGYAVKDDGTVWAWGSNFYGNLGDGTKTDRHLPGQVHGLSNIISIAAGSNDAYALDGSGTLWAWGRNGSGELGDGTFDTPLIPVRVGLPGVKSIGSSCGSTGYAITQDGSVWAWGNNGEGELGIGSFPTASTVPVQVPGLSAAIAVTGGFTSSYALIQGGTLYAWGGNFFGQLGMGGGPQATPVPVTLPAIAIGVTAGRANGYAVLRDGTVAAWGDDSKGQLGDAGAAGTSSSTPGIVPGLSEITSIDAGEDSILALQGGPPGSL